MQRYMRVLLDNTLLVYAWHLSTACTVRGSRAFWLAGAIIFTIIALFSIFAYFGYRARIPLASLLLQVVMDVAKHHWGVYVVAFIALIIQAAWSV